MLRPLKDFIRSHALLRAGDRLGLAVSGGADSVALLRAMVELRSELGIVLSVVHVHHGLRAEADADEAFVRELAAEFSLPCHVAHRDVRTFASSEGLSIEAAGRELRYRYFHELISSGVLDKVATAHTRDDQAETVLMRLLRGAGTSGLAGVYRSVADGAGTARVVRPLLCTARNEIEDYLHGLGQDWREDLSNRDSAFLRNRVRHELLPLLEREFNPRIRQLLARTAEVAHAEEEFWAGLCADELRTRLVERDDEDWLALEGFSQLAVAMQRRLLRGFVERSGAALDFEPLERLRELAARGRAGLCQLPSKAEAELRRTPADGALLCLRAHLPSEAGYELELTLPGEVMLPVHGFRLRVELVESSEAVALSAPGSLLDASLCGRRLLIRNARAGDRFHPAHSAEAQPLKRLLEPLRISARQRRSWPVALLEDEIVWVNGLEAGETHAAESGAVRALRILCE